MNFGFMRTLINLPLSAYNFEIDYNLNNLYKSYSYLCYNNNNLLLEQKILSDMLKLLRLKGRKNGVELIPKIFLRFY